MPYDKKKKDTAKSFQDSVNTGKAKYQKQDASPTAQSMMRLNKKLKANPYKPSAKKVSMKERFQALKKY